MGTTNYIALRLALGEKRVQYSNASTAQSPVSVKKYY